MDSELSIKHRSRRDKTSILLIVVLLVLRFPLLFISASSPANTPFLLAVYLCGTYLCTGLFICINRMHLKQFGMTLAALLLFILAPFTALAANSADPTAWIRIAFALGFGLFLCLKRDMSLLVLSPKKVAVNALFTIVLCVVVPLGFWAIQGFKKVNQDPLTAKWLVGMLGFQLSFAAVSEEPLFRGFLPGYMRRRGMNEWAICLSVALLFWFGHVYYINTGINFWIVHPIGALLIGIVAMKTKSISYAMLFHTCLNGFGQALQLIR